MTTDIKLFDIRTERATEIPGRATTVERSLHDLIERNLEAMLGIRFLASEHSTGRKQRGRIDTLGIDENSSPVIIEYKRTTNQNVINQGLFYLDWLLDHRSEFKLLVLDRLGKAEAEKIDWSAPRLLCIAGGFSRYDEHAVEQMNRNIELIRYRQFGESHLMLEMVNATSAEPDPRPDPGKAASQMTEGPRCLLRRVQTNPLDRTRPTPAMPDHSRPETPYNSSVRCYRRSSAMHQRSVERLAVSFELLLVLIFYLQHSSGSSSTRSRT